MTLFSIRWLFLAEVLIDYFKIFWFVSILEIEDVSLLQISALSVIQIWITKYVKYRETSYSLHLSIV